MGRVIRLDIEYEGTQFYGFGVQPGLRTVGGELSEALGKILGEQVRITPAARTDAGVHARGQVVSFSTEAVVPVEAIRSGTNALTGPDLLARAATVADDAFDARRDAKARRYEYRIWNASEANLWERRWTAHVEEPLDVDRMDRACRVLCGRHDFAAFYTHKAEDDIPRGTVRHLLRADWKRDPSDPRLLRFNVEADAFLRHMVRAIVGSALLVGFGKLPEDAFVSMLESTDRAAAGPTAPAQGLTLLEVVY